MLEHLSREIVNSGSDNNEKKREILEMKNTISKTTKKFTQYA